MAVNVVLKSVWDDKGVKDAQRELGNLGKSVGVAFAAVSAAVVGAGVAIGKFSMDAINAASAFGAEFEGVNQIFGESAKAVQDFAKEASRSAGISETAALQAAKNFGVFATSAGLAGNEASDFAIKLTQAAGDLASFNDVPVEETLAAIRSGLQGQGEPLSRFGILMSEATLKAKAMEMGIIENTKAALTPQQKVLAANKLILDELGVAQGDFVKYQDTFGNRIKTVTAEFENLQVQIGNELLPVAEEFLGAVLDLTPALGDALVPVAKELGDVFRQEVLPQLQAFTKWLASPQGIETVKNFALAIVEGVKALFDLAKKLADNYDKIVGVAGVIVPLIASIKVFTTVAGAARAAMLLFNVALAANPLGALLVVLGLTTAAVIAFTKVTTEEERAARNTAGQIARLKDEQVKLTNKIKQGGIETNQYRNQLRKVNDSLMEVKTGFSTSAGEANKFNNIKLGGARAELTKTADAAALMGNKIANANRELYFAMHPELGGKLPTPKAVSTPTITSASSGPSAREQVQKIIKDAQKQFRKAIKDYRETVGEAQASYSKSLAAAQKAYTESVTAATAARDTSLAEAEKAHAKNIAGIQADFAKRQGDIVKQSIDRLRNAYAQAVQVNVANLFTSEGVGKSVDNLVKSLRDKLTASKQLLENSAKLASQGFSQTFIEQVVGAGTDSGNELANAILNATPEAQAEIKSLFGAIENESETGMDSLAQTLYEKTGLATSELKALFEQTNVDLAKALSDAEASYVETQASILTTFDKAMQAAAETRQAAFDTAQEQLNESMRNAAEAYQETVEAIKESFLEQISEVEDGLGGLEATVNSFVAALNTAISKAATLASMPVSAPSITTTFPTSTPSASGVVATTTFPAISTSVKSPTTTATKPTTVVNVNVKTDSTQSTAQVGKKIATTINKYTTLGGALKTGVGAV